VTAHAIDIVRTDADTVTLRVECSAGFYVRSLAHDLGERLGIGAHLVALRRTRAGDFTLNGALPLETAEQYPDRAIAAVMAMADMLPRLPMVMLTPEGVRRALNGCMLGQADIARSSASQLSPQSPLPGLPSPSSPTPNPHPPLTRLLDPAGRLVGIGRRPPGGGLLHPFVILG
jgi:tRNA U55 pseudouridine synthase TruB